MKKLICLIIVSLFLVPAASAFRLYVAPEAGAAYSWEDLSNADAKNLFTVGFSGGVLVEVAISDIFWVKSGVRYKRLAVLSEWTVNAWSPPGYQSESYYGYNLVEIPVLIGLSSEISSGIKLHAGLGVKIDFVLSGDYWSKSLDEAYSYLDESGDTYIESMVWFAGSAVAGAKFAAGPGSITTGLAFTVYSTGSDLINKIMDIELTAGYEFSIL